MKKIVGSLVLTTLLTVAAFATPASATDLVNPENIDNPSASFEPVGPSIGITPFASGYWDDSGVAILASAKTAKVNQHNGSFRVSFSTAAILNRKNLPTKVTFDGESQLIWTGTKVPVKVVLTDRVVVRGVALATSVGSGTNVSGSPVEKVVGWTTQKTNTKKNEHTFRNWVFSGSPVLGVKEAVTGEVHFSSGDFSVSAGTF